MKLILTLSVLFHSSLSLAGFGSHGGDLCEVEFKGLIPSAGSWLEDNKSVLKLTTGYAELKAKLDTVTIRCVDTAVTLNGVAKTAITDTATAITTVNTPRWHQGSLVAKRAVVLHEGLVLLGLEKTDDYHISEKLFGAPAKQFKRMYCVDHFSDGGPVTDTMVEISASPRKKTEAEERIFRLTPMYQVRVLRGRHDAATGVMTASETYVINDHLRCKNSVVDERLVTCGAFIGPFNTDPTTRGIDVVHTSLFTRQQDDTTMFRMEIQSPAVANIVMPSSAGNFHKLKVEPVQGASLWRASHDYRYVRDTQAGWIYSYCAIE